MKYVTLGILAHVDAGKTTLSESLMYNLGKINIPGRVDNGNAFLDTDPLEKERGITIFSKQAVLTLGDVQVTLLDTPGHVDFSAETERTLSVLDAAILVISAKDKVQSHTRTIWKLLRERDIPTYVFVNKMDQDGSSKEAVLGSLSTNLSEKCVDFSEIEEPSDELLEKIAICDETLLEKYLVEESISVEDIRAQIQKCNVFPVFFGSALKNEGIEEFITGLSKLLTAYESMDGFSARVYKISRDDKEERLTHVKIIGGKLSVRDTLGTSKVTAIRLYDGAKYMQLKTAYAGQVVAIAGIADTYPGEGLGDISDDAGIQLVPTLSYSIILPKDINKSDALLKLKMLTEEQPELMIEEDSDSGSINICLMGDVQIEILRKKIYERFGIDIEFGDKHIIYKETITNKVEGVGHFEPLRHYAEAHLILEPLAEGSGMVFETDCREEVLDKNWQRLILTHLKEKPHKGVLTGSMITDMKITLVSGKAHLKHTEGGDFRQATYRAVRNGLMYANSKLLEPYYDFILEIPSDYVGRAMTDLDKRNARDYIPEINGNIATLRGIAPVATMSDYGSEVAAYSGGEGILSLSFRGYMECHNAEEVIEKIGYVAERDTDNTADSVFCYHGSGEVIPWNEVRNHMHIEGTII